MASVAETVESSVDNYGLTVQQAADDAVGGRGGKMPYADICVDADAIKIADLIKESASTEKSFSEAFQEYYSNHVKNRYVYLLNDIGCLPNMTALYESLLAGIAGPPNWVLGGRVFSDDISKACCKAFANYIYCELA